MRSLYAPVSLVLLLAAAPVFAQPAAAPKPSGPALPRVGLSIDPGLSASSSDAGFALGGTVSVAATDRLEFEATVRHLERAKGVDGLHAALGVRVNLTSPSHRLVPYVMAGGGVYRASVDMGRRDMFGMMSQGVPAGTRLVALPGNGGFGMMWGTGTPGTWPGPMTPGSGYGPGYGPYFGTYTPQSMPRFYAGRMGNLSVPANGRWDDVSFSDPAASLGVGARIDLGRGFYAQPDVRAIVVFGDGRSDTTVVSGLTFGYRF